MSAKFFPNGRQAAVSLSFDDARLSQADVGLPLLDELGVRATFYIMAEGVAQRLGAWQQAIAAGHEIGNHTLTHPCSGNFPWSRDRAIEDFTLDRMEQELIGANTTILEMLGVAPTTFAYPCGQTYVGRGQSLKSYIPLVAKHFLAGRGFRQEVANDPEFCDVAQLCAYDSDGKSFEELRILVDTAIEQGRWLVLAGHEIGEQGRQTTRVSTIQELCRYCMQRQEEVWIDTVAAVATHITSVREQQNRSGEQSCTG